MSNGDGPTTLQDWIQYLHDASKVRKGEADYAEAQDAITHALAKINALNVGQDMAEANANEKPSLPQSIATVIGQGPGLGTGEVFRGLGTAVTGQGFRKGAQEYREAVDQAEAANPNLMALGETVGTAALPAGQLGSGAAGAVRAGVPLGVSGAAKLIGRGALQAAIPGAVAGFSQGGEDPGDFGARGVEAGTGAILAGLLGGVGTAAAIPAIRGHVERAADLTRKGNQRALTAQRLADAPKRSALLDSRLELNRTRIEALRAQPKGGAVIIPEDLLERGDVRQAVSDYNAGRLDQDGLEAALEYARRDAPYRSSTVRQTGGAEPTPVRSGAKPFAGEAPKPIPEGPPGSAKPADNFPRGPGGSVRWSSTQLPDPGMNLNSPAALKQLQTLQHMSPAELRVALQNPLLAQLAKALGVTK